MSIGRKNSGFVKQDGIIAGFAKEARTAASGSDAVAIAMRGRAEREAYAASRLVETGFFNSISQCLFISG
jgi:hypothetical protein